MVYHRANEILVHHLRILQSVKRYLMLRWFRKLTIAMPMSKIKLFRRKYYWHNSREVYLVAWNLDISRVICSYI